MSFAVKRYWLGAILIWSLLASPAFARQALATAAQGSQPTCAASSSAATPDSGEQADIPAWKTIPLTDVLTGAEFSIDDYRGCAIYVEPMATWCINCKMQMENVKNAIPLLERDRHVVITLSVETELPPEELKEYAEKGGYEWIFTVATEDMVKAIVDEFGRSVMVPPSTPHFYVFPDGTFSELKTGGEDAESIVETMNQASGT